jgi:anti-anti-sigma factor
MGPRPVGGPVVVAFPPEIDDANAEQTCAQLYEAFASGAAVVIADLTATTFCDSSGIQQLMKAHAHAISVGAQLRVAVSPRGAVARVVELMGVGETLHIYARTDDAAAFLAAPTYPGRRAGSPQTE